MYSNMQDLKDEETLRSQIVLWKHPLTTINYFLREVCHLTKSVLQRISRRKTLLLTAISLTVTLYILYKVNGPHQLLLMSAQKQVLWCLYWLSLGLLSSVGLGTGLHTFILYLGPHIAAVTLAAYECHSVEFPEPPYPDEIICPDDDNGYGVSIFQIMSKVRLEAMMWGAGTALGELPPYFMARAARLSGCESDEEEDLKKFLDLQKLKNHPEDMNWLDRVKLTVENLVETVGFAGILACASIPNPLFDLAGIACGHCLVPFWTFFGATLLGKAVIKMHIQQLFVIFVLSESLIESAVSLTGRVPLVGKRLREAVKEFLQRERLKLHRRSSGDQGNSQRNIIVWMFEKFVLVMILYFVISIINSLAQNYHKKICKENRQQKIA